MQNVPDHTHASFPIHRIPVFHKTGFDMINLDEIVFIRSKGHWVELHYRGKKEPVKAYYSIADLEIWLARHGFIRIHRSYLINIMHLLSYDYGKTGHAHMIEDHILYVTAEYTEALKNAVMPH